MNVHDLPVDMQHFCEGIWEEIAVGHSGNAVFRITYSQGQSSYLKVAKHPFEQELLAEKERLEWLHERLPVPSVVAYATDNQHTYLLISEIQGLMAYDEHFAQDVPTVVRLLAQGLWMLHELNITDCPFDQSLSHKITLAQERVHAGLVNEADFDEKHEGMHTDELLNRLLECQPKTENIVFTHGDYCLPNILIDPFSMQLSGFIDLGRAGIADRYHDLALAARSLAYNFGPGWEPFLWEAYGLKNVDVAKIQFYQLLDELL